MFNWVESGYTTTLYTSPPSTPERYLGHVKQWKDFTSGNTTYHAFFGSSSLVAKQVGHGTKEAMKVLLEEKARELLAWELAENWNKSVRDPRNRVDL